MIIVSTVCNMMQYWAYWTFHATQLIYIENHVKSVLTVILTDVFKKMIAFSTGYESKNNCANANTYHMNPHIPPSSILP